MTRFPNTIVALLGLLIFGTVILVLLAPGLHADPAQVAIIIGVFLVILQQLLTARATEANGHRLTNVENVAAAALATSTGQDPASLTGSTPIATVQAPAIVLPEPPKDVPPPP